MYSIVTNLQENIMLISHQKSMPKIKKPHSSKIRASNMYQLIIIAVHSLYPIPPKFHKFHKISKRNKYSSISNSMVTS